MFGYLLKFYNTCFMRNISSLFKKNIKSISFQMKNWIRWILLFFRNFLCFKDFFVVWNYIIFDNVRLSSFYLELWHFYTRHIFHVGHFYTLQKFLDILFLVTVKERRWWDCVSETVLFQLLLIFVLSQLFF